MEVRLNEEDGMKAPCAVNLHNTVTVSQQRLGKRVAYGNGRSNRQPVAARRVPWVQAFGNYANGQDEKRAAHCSSAVHRSRTLDRPRTDGS